VPSPPEASQREHPLRFVAELDKPRKGQDPPEREGIVRINLNRIQWKWKALTREEAKEKGPRAIVEEGPEFENTPIEVNLDGTDLHGVWIRLERHVLQKDGTYKPAESDFTHYLAPHEHEIDFNILKPEPLPWDAPQPKREIETVWWAQALPEDHEILQRLPVETSMRVKAWLANSIVERYSDNHIRRVPDKPDELATRERRPPLC
jgi:hypothetical protein